MAVVDGRRAGLRPGLTVAASDLVQVVRGGRRTLDGVSLSVRPGELVAVIGASGAGKTTLLDALAGVRPPAAGSVRHDGRPAPDAAAGYVPQDDIIHQQLPLARTLRYAARLRLPAGTPPDEVDRRVAEVLDVLGLTGRAAVRVGSLSGGERKRASIAVELLARPRALFLDEPTSGLDPAAAAELLGLLGRVAAEGVPVVLTTHNPADVDRCDTVVVLAPGGRLVFAGPPGDAPGHFGADDVPGIYGRLADAPAWPPRPGSVIPRGADTRAPRGETGGRATAGGVDGRATAGGVDGRATAGGVDGRATAGGPGGRATAGGVDSRSSADGLAVGRASADGPEVGRASTEGLAVGRAAGEGPVGRRATGADATLPRRPPGALRQTGLLTARNLAILRANRLTLAILAGSPVVILAMFLMLFRAGAFAPRHPDPATTVMILFWIAFGVFFFGLTYGLLQICAELPILRREVFGGLGLGPYLAAKVALLLPPLALADLVLLAVLRGLDRLPPLAAGQFAGLYLTALLASACALALGLLCSASVSDIAQATLLLPMLCFPQVLFVGAILPVPVMAPVGRWLSAAMSNRWSFEALGHGAGLPALWRDGGSPLGPPLLAAYGGSFDRPVWQNWLILAAMTVVFLAGAVLVLRRRCGRSA